MMRTFTLLVLGLALTPPASAQEEWGTVNGAVAERWRMSQALGLGDAGGFLVRSPSSSLAREAPQGPGVELRALPLKIASVWNSGLPRSFNDGALWAGRGVNLILRGGLAASWGPVRLAVAPEIVYSQNRPFQVFPSTDEGRSPFASPWHSGENSLDLPLRFGIDDRVTMVPGQSSVQVVWSHASVGFATENIWWGPGLRNALVLSNNAPGFPHVFLRTLRPVAGSWGSLEGAWIAGTLTESLYFDRVPDNDHRSIAGLTVVYRPPVADEVAFGFARAVVRALNEAAASPTRLPDALLRWNDDESDQVTSFFLRWLPQGSGLDLFVEWAWTELPSSLRELLTQPQDTRGYTMGLQWTGKVSPEPRWVRVELEATNLERALSRRDDTLPPDFYAGQASPHGFTHRGQLLGAAVGPGGQSQWLAVDLLDPKWSAGLTFNRIRWEDDALFRQPGSNFFRHDFSLTGGVRGSWRTETWELRAEALLGKRHNYLFQNGFTNPAGVRTVDIPNHTLSLSVLCRL